MGLAELPRFDVAGVWRVSVEDNGVTGLDILIPAVGGVERFRSRDFRRA